MVTFLWLLLSLFVSLTAVANQRANALECVHVYRDEDHRTLSFPSSLSWSGDPLDHGKTRFLSPNTHFIALQNIIALGIKNPKCS